MNLALYKSDYNLLPDTVENIFRLISSQTYSNQCKKSDHQLTNCPSYNRLYFLNLLKNNHQIKKKKVRKIKTDPIDTHRIAHAYFQGEVSPQYVPPAQITELRSLCRQYDGLNVLYTEAQQRFRSIVALIFPQYDKVLAKLCGLTSLNVLAAYPTPQDLLSANEEELREILHMAKKLCTDIAQSTKYN